MYRKIIEKLVSWKEQKDKKALLVTGARQIGKTYIIREFAKNNYSKFVEINFLTQPSAKDIFSGDLDFNTLQITLSSFLKTSLVKGETLIFLDEIQECPNARTAIKFLVENGSYDIIESGSLLGVQYKNVPSFPVGYEQILHMYPMDFEEFCLANGVQRDTLHYLHDCYSQRKEIALAIHKKMLNLFRYYMIVGGMPFVVKKFVENNDIYKVIESQKDILDLYRQDVNKYSQNGKAQIQHIFDTIPSQLEDKNRRFNVNSLSSNARLRDYKDSFLWLKDAGVALPSFNVSEPVVPLKLNEKNNLFKLYLSDTGLLCSMSLENVQFAILSDNLKINAGGIFENIFAQNLKSNGFELRYLNRKNIGEIDFVVQNYDRVIPVEIKSGNDYKKHSALNNLLNKEAWNIERGYVFCRGNLEVEERITYLPWYMIMFFKTELPDLNSISKLDLTGL